MFYLVKKFGFLVEVWTVFINANSYLSVALNSTVIFSKAVTDFVFLTYTCLKVFHIQIFVFWIFPVRRNLCSNQLFRILFLQTWWVILPNYMSLARCDRVLFRKFIWRHNNGSPVRKSLLIFQYIDWLIEWKVAFCRSITHNLSGS